MSDEKNYDIKVSQLAEIHLDLVVLSQLSTTYRARVIIFAQLSQLGGENGVCEIGTQA